MMQTEIQLQKLPLGNRKEYGYDAEGNLTSYEYDGNGNCIKMTTSDGETVYEYDELDRLIKTVYPDGNS